MMAYLSINGSILKEKGIEVVPTETGLSMADPALISSGDGMEIQYEGNNEDQEDQKELLQFPWAVVSSNSWGQPLHWPQPILCGIFPNKKLAEQFAILLRVEKRMKG